MTNEIVKQDHTLKFEISTEENQVRMKQLQQFIKTQMVDNEDYGIIPGTKKPTLFKPGAEKLENIFGLNHEFEQLDKVEDWDKGFFFYRYKCSVFHKKNGVKVAECIGSANTKEKGRVNQEPYTLVNTIDKMAQKRAYVGAILNASRVSNTFTQDLEDTPEVAKQNPQRKEIPTEYNCEGCKVHINEKVADFSLKKYNKMLCMQCQGKENAK